MTQPMRDRPKIVPPPDEKIVAVPEATTSVAAQTTQPIVVAMIRGVLLALVIAAIDFFTCYQLGFSAAKSLVSAALLFFVTLQARGVIEGAFDQFKASKV